MALKGGTDIFRLSCSSAVGRQSQVYTLVQLIHELCNVSDIDVSIKLLTSGQENVIEKELSEQH